MAKAVPVEYQARTGINSRADYEALYNRSIQDPAGFWADLARQFHWEKPVRPCPLGCTAAPSPFLHVHHAQAALWSYPCSTAAYALIHCPARI